MSKYAKNTFKFNYLGNKAPQEKNLFYIRFIFPNGIMFFAIVPRITPHPVFLI